MTERYPGWAVAAAILAYLTLAWALIIATAAALLTLPADRLALAAVLAFLVAMVVHAARAS